MNAAIALWLAFSVGISGHSGPAMQPPLAPQGGVVATPVPAGSGDGGGEVVAMSTAAPTPVDGEVSAAGLVSGGTDLSTIVLIFSGIFACIGVFRGSGREITALLGVLPAYLLFSRGWASVAGLINNGWDLLMSLLAMAGMPSPSGAVLVNPSAEARLAQVTVFSLAIFLIYLATRRGVLPTPIERLIGALVGSFIGYLVGVFVLSRLLPGASISVTSPGTTALTWISRLGPAAAMAFICAVILLGFRSLGPKGSSARRY